MVAYYYFPGGSGVYDQRAKYVDAYGGEIAAEKKIGPCYTNPCGSETFDISAYATDSFWWRNLGEYQDMSFVSGKWYSGAVGVVPCPNSYVTCHGNPFVTITQP